MSLLQAHTFLFKICNSNLLIMHSQKFYRLIYALPIIFCLASCSLFGNKKNEAAKIIFSKPKNLKIKDQKLLVDPCLVKIPGGSYASGIQMSNAQKPQTRPIKKIQISEFYVNATLTTNLEYRTYVQTLQKAIDQPQDAKQPEKPTKKDTQKTTPTQNNTVEQKSKNQKKSPLKKDPKKTYEEALPDFTVWNNNFSSDYNDKGNRYFYAEQYSHYPVVGVSFVQATAYCTWKTTLYQATEEAFQAKKRKRTVSKEEIVTRKYALPTEIEWEYATAANDMDVGLPREKAKRIYPWDGKSFVIDRGPHLGIYKANFKKGPGNYGEIDAYPTAPVMKYPANDFGIYVGGNLREWTCDIYREDTLLDTNDLNPCRKDGTQDPAANYDPQNSLINDKVRVIKGASWRDSPYYLQMATRRYWKEDASSADIGFRCVMHF